MIRRDDGESKSRGLAEYLGELQLKDDANDRYIAALRRETLEGEHIRNDGESKSRGLAEYLGELQLKDDANDRYIAALRRETLGRNPYKGNIFVVLNDPSTPLELDIRDQ
ncbi:hypothetical protein CFP56_021606 [Quercus suber]|uniref:Uncharacterized protein n=1 Tax=Quercus suber TaxID=58331 RepID=A0AAW0M1U9_QUESU